MELGKKRFDVIVVGSGVAGSTVARELRMQGKAVLILERGDDVRVKESIASMVSVVDGIGVGERLSAARALVAGGTSTIYFSVADTPPVEALQSLGVDISAEYEQTKKELPLTVLPDELLGPRALKIQRTAIDLGYDWEKRKMLVDLSKVSSGYSGDAKWTARDYLDEAVANGATLVARATVLKVLTENGRAVGVEYSFRKGKKDHEIRRAFGGQIVLAAGSAATPIILRESGIKNIVGSGFYCHPSFVVSGLTSGLKPGENFGGALGAELNEGITLGDANFNRFFHRVFMLDSRKFIRTLLHTRCIGVGVMVKDEPGGGLQEDGRYRKELRKEDRERLEKGAKMAENIVRHAGGKRIFRSNVGAAHLGGLIRIREHIDSDLQTEFANLYVCDGSVVPAEKMVSPTLTLVCLGKYLANRLAAAFR